MVSIASIEQIFFFFSLLSFLFSFLFSFFFLSFFFLFFFFGYALRNIPQAPLAVLCFESPPDVLCKEMLSFER